MLSRLLKIVARLYLPTCDLFVIMYIESNSVRKVHKGAKALQHNFTGASLLMLELEELAVGTGGVEELCDYLLEVASARGDAITHGANDVSDLILEVPKILLFRS